MLDLSHIRAHSLKNGKKIYSTTNWYLTMKILNNNDVLIESFLLDQRDLDVDEYNRLCNEEDEVKQKLKKCYDYFEESEYKSRLYSIQTTKKFMWGSFRKHKERTITYPELKNFLEKIKNTDYPYSLEDIEDTLWMKKI